MNIRFDDKAATLSRVLFEATRRLELGWRHSTHADFARSTLLDRSDEAARISLNTASTLLRVEGRSDLVSFALEPYGQLLETGARAVARAAPPGCAQCTPAEIATSTAQRPGHHLLRYLAALALSELAFFPPGQTPRRLLWAVGHSGVRWAQPCASREALVEILCGQQWVCRRADVDQLGGSLLDYVRFLHLARFALEVSIGRENRRLGELLEAYCPSGSDARIMGLNQHRMKPARALLEAMVKLALDEDMVLSQLLLIAHHARIDVEPTDDDPDADQSSGSIPQGRTMQLESSEPPPATMRLMGVVAAHELCEILERLSEPHGCDARPEEIRDATEHYVKAATRVAQRYDGEATFRHTLRRELYRIGTPRAVAARRWVNGQANVSAARGSRSTSISARLAAVWDAVRKGARDHGTFAPARPRRRVGLLATATAGLVALGLTVVAVWPGPEHGGPPREVLVKGSWRLHVAAQREGEIFRVVAGRALRSGDELGFFYTAPSAGHLMIVHVDEAGQISRLFPRLSDHSAPLPRGIEVPIKAGATVTPIYGCEWLIGLWAPESFTLDQARGAMAHAIEHRHRCKLGPVDFDDMQAQIYEVQP